MLLLRAFKKFKETLRKEAELSQAMRRLANIPMDYETIQMIADTVSSGYEVKIHVKQPDGTEITVERSKPQNQIEYKSFQERFREAHQ
ncbi:MAG: hypothetical protein II411_05230 [Lachnospiraceae bacterium]|nr:hypothetical protein [Lachnospiraceae bacterium]